MASAISSLVQNQGVVRKAQFSVAADAAPSAIAFNAGFTPRMVHIANITDGAHSIWVEGLGTAPVLTGGTPSGFGSFSVSGNTVNFTPTASKALTVIVTD